jgi:hypothetical protein
MIDNKRFAGKFGVEGETNPPDDAFNFKDGKFASDSCLKWGFRPAPYFVRRRDDGKLQFIAILESPDHGVMHYEGSFDGKEINATAKWTKERWYWTSRRTYVFSSSNMSPAKPGDGWQN